MAENYVFNNGLDDGGMGAIGRWATGWAQGQSFNAMQLLGTRDVCTIVGIYPQ